MRSGSETAKGKSLPMPLVLRVFARLRGMYGSKFIAAWDGVSREEMERAWSDGLAGLSTDEIKRGLSGCLERPFPPTLPEFRLLCRQGARPPEEATRLTPEEREAERRMYREAAERNMPKLQAMLGGLADKMRMPA